jgi:hypothetical protein
MSHLHGRIFALELAWFYTVAPGRFLKISVYFHVQSSQESTQRHEKYTAEIAFTVQSSQESTQRHEKYTAEIAFITVNRFRQVET